MKMLDSVSEAPLLTQKYLQIRSLGEFVTGVTPLACSHLKPQTESPSSLVVTTKNAIVPHFTAPSLNCGIALMRTGLLTKDLPCDFVQKFINAFARSITNELEKYDLNLRELFAVCTSGAKALLNKYRLSEDTLGAFDNDGLLGESFNRDFDIQLLVPPRGKKTELGFGTMLGGNHFLELQTVERIFQVSAGSKSRIAQDELVVMYHTGGGFLSWVMGRYYSSRKKDTGFEKARLFVEKLIFHFLQRQGWRSYKKTWRHYFSRRQFIPFFRNSPEYDILRKTIEIAMNYGFAYRLATFVRIRDILKELIKSSDLQIELICDSHHNSILPSVKGGDTYWTHRHNACKVIPQKLNILAGNYDLHSYLLLGSSGSYRSLHSIDHGVASHIDKNKLDYTDYVATVYKKINANSDGLKRQDLRIRDSQTIDDVVKLYSKHNVVQPVAKLRPIASMK